MKTKEQAEAVTAAVARLEGVPGAGIGLGTMSHEELVAFAEEVGAPVKRSLYATPEGPRVLEHIDWHPRGVYVSAGTGYLSPDPGDDLSKAYDVARKTFVDLRPKSDPATCSECSGPLDEEALYGPTGARCRTCCDREADAETARGRIAAKKVYGGNVRAEERAIDAGVRGGA